MFDVEAGNHGYDAMPGHAERYRRAEDFVRAVLGLWDSWADDALTFDRHGHYADPDRVQPINHHGEFFRVDGPLNVPRPVLGHPVLFQAGASEQGRALAAKCAEAIYAVACNDLPAARNYYRDIKQRIEAAGRNVTVPIMPGLVACIIPAEARALAKQRELDELFPVDAFLRQLAMFIDQDCFDWALDAVPYRHCRRWKNSTGRRGTMAPYCELLKLSNPTCVSCWAGCAAGVAACTMVGTPEQITRQDVALRFNDGGADGFNLMPPSLPNGIEDFIEQVVPELQHHSLFRNEYQGSTFAIIYGWRDLVCSEPFARRCNLVTYVVNAAFF